MKIEYKVNPPITTDEFIEVLKNSTLGERRPIDDIECIKGMVKNANIIITATQNDKIVGLARAVTDFHYCCYLSDLAVDKSCQKSGVGKKLIEIVQAQIGENCKIILLSAPQAAEYYPKIGFKQHQSAWVIKSTDALK